MTNLIACSRDESIEKLVDEIGDFFPIAMIDEWIHDRSLNLWKINTDGSDIGVLFVQVVGHDAELRYIYIVEELRGLRIGKDAMELLLYKLYKLGCDNISVIHLPGSNEDIDRLVNGFKMAREIGDENVGNFVLTLGELTGYKEFNTKANNVVALSELKEDDIDELNWWIEGEQINYLGRLIVPEEFEDFSGVFINDGPKGVLLVKKIDDKRLQIPLLASTAKNMMSPIEMIRFVIEQSKKIYSDDTVVEFCAVDESLFNIFNKLFPGRNKPFVKYTKYIKSYKQYDYEFDQYN